MLAIALMMTLAAGQTEPAEPPLPALLDQIRLSVPDARTIADLQICPPVKVSKDGSKFTVPVAFSRLNAARHYYFAVWRGGAYAQLIDSGAGGDTLGDLKSSGFAILTARDMEKRLKTCRWVSPDELKAAWETLDHH